MKGLYNANKRTDVRISRKCRLGKVKAAGYQFAMLSAGYGFNTIDPQFKRNASGM